MTESPREAARRLAQPWIVKGFKPIALHEYANASGETLYWRFRLKNAEGEKIIRPFHLNGNGYTLGEPHFPAGNKPLYKLHRLVDDSAALVWIVEGEKAADALVKLGANATTSGGADSAKSADWTPLAGRTCILWPDNDVPGRGYMGDVAAILASLGCTLYAIDVDALGLPTKGDAADWAAAHPEATLADLVALPKVEASTTTRHAPEADSGPHVDLLCAADVTPERVEWLWNGWLPAGKLTIVAGPPGTGKTTIALALAATLTIGGRWPDGLRAKPATVAVWSGEDGIADTLVPRLLANGADSARVHFVGSVTNGDERRPFDPAKDTPLLELALARLPSPTALLIVDPIVSAVAGDSHKNSETRRSLQPLVNLGDLIGCAIVGISHFSKGTGGRDPVERVTGSIAFGALARVVLGVVKTTGEDGNPGPRLLARAKSNLGPDGGGFYYSLEQAELRERPGVFASRVSWGAPVEGEARALLAAAEADQASDDAVDRRHAVAWLQEVLAASPLPVRDIRKQSDEAGFAWRTMQRAMRDAGVVSRRGGFGKSAEWARAPQSRHSRQPLETGATCERGATGEGGEVF